MTAGTYNVIFWDFVSKIRPGLAFLLGEGLRTGQMGSVTGCYKRTRGIKEAETKEEMEEGTKEESVEGKRGSTAAEAGEQELLNDVNTGSKALRQVRHFFLEMEWKSSATQGTGWDAHIRAGQTSHFPKQHVFKLVAAKVAKVRKRKYVRHEVVKSLTDYFDVPKGATDIRGMVYNGTVSWLNEALCAPSFYIPTSTVASRLISFYLWCVDLDLGERFLNFPMDMKIRPFAGVDLTPLAQHLGVILKYGEKMVGTLGTFVHGMKSAPYNVVLYFYLAEEFAQGDPAADNNALQFDRVVLNLPEWCATIRLNQMS